MCVMDLSKTHYMFQHLARKLIQIIRNSKKTSKWAEGDVTGLIGLGPHLIVGEEQRRTRWALDLCGGGQRAAVLVHEMPPF